MSTNVAVASSVKQEPRCKRPAGPLTRRQRSSEHRTEMQIRRALQRQRVSGFTPVYNRRISDGIQAAFALLMLENADKIPTGVVTVEGLQQQAVAQIQRRLPPAPQVFNWMKGLPTRNNDAAYRKDFVRDLRS